MRKYLVIVVSALALSGAAGASETPTAPESGTYAVNIIVQWTDGSDCLDQPDYQFIGELSYGGLSGKTDYIRIPIASPSGNTISTQALTVTHGLGSTSPSGSFRWTGTGSQQWSETGSFKGTITEVGTHSFIATLQETYSNCTESIGVSAVRFGADNG